MCVSFFPVCLWGKQGLGSVSLSVVWTQLDWRGQLSAPSLLFGFPEKSKIMIGECCPNLGFIGAKLPLCNHYRQSCVLPLILAVCNSLIIPSPWRTSHGDQGGTGELQRSTCPLILSKTFWGRKRKPLGCSPISYPRRRGTPPLLVNSLAQGSKCIIFCGGTMSCFPLFPLVRCEPICSWCILSLSS